MGEINWFSVVLTAEVKPRREARVGLNELLDIIYQLTLMISPFTKRINSSK